MTGSPAMRLIVIGLGDSAKVSAESFRIAGGVLAKLVVKQKLASVAVLNAADPASLVTGFILGGFHFTDYKGTGSKEPNPSFAGKLRMVGKTAMDQRSQIERAVKIADAQNYARTIASRPG